MLAGAACRVEFRWELPWAFLWAYNRGMTPIQAIEALSARPMTEAAIAEAVGVRQPTINKIRKGVMRPNWELGDRLVQLAMEQAPKAKKRRRKAA